MLRIHRVVVRSHLMYVLVNASPWKRSRGPPFSMPTRVVPVRPSGEDCLIAGEVSSEGSYVVTGGTGGIGLDLALRFAKAGAGGLVLLSRCAVGWLDTTPYDTCFGSLVLLSGCQWAS